MKAEVVTPSTKCSALDATNARSVGRDLPLVLFDLYQYLTYPVMV